MKSNHKSILDRTLIALSRRPGCSLLGDSKDHARFQCSHTKNGTILMEKIAFPIIKREWVTKMKEASYMNLVVSDVKATIHFLKSLFNHLCLL
jgi:hypothetical protein